MASERTLVRKAHPFSNGVELSQAFTEKPAEPAPAHRPPSPVPHTRREATAKHAAARISLATPWIQPSDVVGHAHVFAAKNQSISLVFPPPRPKTIAARLYRTGGKTLAPESEPILVSPGDDGVASLTIDFPESDRPTRHLLVFEFPKKQILEITAHPKSLLDPLRESAKRHPLVIVRAPAGLAAVLEALRLPAEFKDTAPETAKAPVIVFPSNANHRLPAKLEAPRIIVVRPENAGEEWRREIWVQPAPNRWKISVPAAAFHPAFLADPAGQVALLRLLTADPGIL